MGAGQPQFVYEADETRDSRLTQTQGSSIMMTCLETTQVNHEGVRQKWTMNLGLLAYNSIKPF